MKLLNFGPFKRRVALAPCPPGSLGDAMQLDPTKDVYIQTGSGSFDGAYTFTGFPFTKTNIARKPSKLKGEIACRQCGGDGWDADSGGTFICPTCKGTGVEDGTAICVCGHKLYEHYMGGTCEWDHLNLYGSYYRKDGKNPLIHPLRDKEYNIENRPCMCEKFRDASSQEEVLDYIKGTITHLQETLQKEQANTIGFMWLPSLYIPDLKNAIRLLKPYLAEKEQKRKSSMKESIK